MKGFVDSFKQPKSFINVFSVEVWERYGFYSVQGILAVYFVKHIGMTETHSMIVLASFSALLYGLICIGGFIGDRILGTRRTILLGAVILAIGYFLMSASVYVHSLIYLALGVICVGNGLFKANPSSLLGKCYGNNRSKMDAGFTLYYLAINLGGLAAFTFSPEIANHLGYGTAYLFAAIGLVIGTANWLLLQKWVKDIGSDPDLKPLNLVHFIIVIAGAILVAIASALLLQHLTIAHDLLYTITIVVALYFLYQVIQESSLKMAAAFILMLQGVVFFVLYIQMPTSLTFFAINNVHHNLLGISIDPQSFQSLNCIWIIIGSFVLAPLYSHLGSKKKDLGMPYKFAVGMFLCAFGFLVLTLSAHFANMQGIVSSNWLIASYGFQSIGELMISGLGVSMVAQLCPKRLHGLAMGIWFLTMTVASVLGGIVAAWTAVPKNLPHDAQHTLSVYAHVFKEIGVTTLIIAVITLALAPVLTYMIKAPSKVRSSSYAKSAS